MKLNSILRIGLAFVGRSLLPVLMVALAAQAQAQAAEKISKDGPKETLTVAVSGETLIFFPLYVARAAGFFDEEGIKVDWVNVGPSSRQTPAVMGGSADVTPIALFHMLHAEKRGLKLVAVSNLFGDPALQLTLTNDAVKKTGITPSMPLKEKLERLKGLTIGTSAPGSGTETMFRKMFAARGIDVDKWVQLKPVGGAAPSLAAFEQGLVEGVVYPAPVPEIIEDKGIGVTVIDGFKEKIDEVDGVPFLVLATSRDTLKKKPMLMEGTVRALAKAMSYTKQHPEKMEALLRPYFTNVDERIFKSMVLAYAGASAATPLITAENVEKTAKWLSIGANEPFEVQYEAIVSPEPAKSIVAALSSGSPGAIK